MLPTPAAAALLGQILGTAFACGLNLYATVALLGVASRMGWIDGLPVGLRGLESGVVILSAAILYLVEFVLDKIPYVDSAWDAAHTVVRPLGATLLLFFALDNLPWNLRIAGATIAGAAALTAHGAKAGTRVILNAAPRRRITALVSGLEDLLAVSLAIAAVTVPVAAFVAVTVLCIALPIFAPGVWRAALLGVRAAMARLRAFFGEPGWRQSNDLPHDLRSQLLHDEIGVTPCRATRAALAGARGPGPYRNGWLVFDRAGPAFLYRSLLRPRRLDLPPAITTRLRKGLLTDIVAVHTTQSDFTLFLLKDGPPAEVTLAELGSQ